MNADSKLMLDSSLNTFDSVQNFVGVHEYH